MCVPRAAIPPRSPSDPAGPQKLAGETAGSLLEGPGGGTADAGGLNPPAIGVGVRFPPRARTLVDSEGPANARHLCFSLHTGWAFWVGSWVENGAQGCPRCT